MQSVSVVVEGITDEAVARRLLEHAGLTLASVHLADGKARLDLRLPAYRLAARHGLWLVLRDLDHDAACAAEWLRTHLPEPVDGLACRLAVREVEAWLLGDHEAMAEHLAVPLSRLPLQPEVLDHPKDALIALARHSRRRVVRQDLVPAAGSSARVGRGYTASITEYASRRWRPDVAAACCPSLSRCLAALARWAQPVP